MLSKSKYLVLSPTCYLKNLEKACVYNIATDVLYEPNSKAFAFLSSCNGLQRISELQYEPEFLELCLKEKILLIKARSSYREIRTGKAPRPSLRYLELQITARCNLKCRHCYLDEPNDSELSLSEIKGLFREFEDMQGLRLLLSGGEPLLHTKFREINSILPQFGFRTVLLSNGTLISRKVASQLKVHEVQLSIDGMQTSHDLLRGRGTFRKTLDAVNFLHEYGIAVSVATMIHPANLQDFPHMKRLFRSLKIREWNIDLPCAAGRLVANAELQVPFATAAPLLKYAYGGGLYASTGKYACGAHLCTVLPDGMVAKCGFFANEPVGHISAGLRHCWGKVPHMKLSELQCKCRYLQACRGGCRFRALTFRDIHAPDPLQCLFHGVPLN